MAIQSIRQHIQNGAARLQEAVIGNINVQTIRTVALNILRTMVSVAVGIASGVINGLIGLTVAPTLAAVAVLGVALASFALIPVVVVNSARQGYTNGAAYANAFVNRHIQPLVEGAA